MDQVLDLSDRLREWGVDCRLDQYEDSPQEGWARWCSGQIEDADFVLIVCSSIYHNRYSGRDRKGIGKGVKWEGAIITQELYESEAINSKYIPVILSSDHDRYIIRELRQTTVYDLSVKEGFERLYRRITNQPLTLKPSLGSVRSFEARDRKQDFRVSNGNYTLPGERNGKVPYYLLFCALVLMGAFVFYRLPPSDTTVNKEKWQQAIQTLESRLSDAHFPDDGYGDRLSTRHTPDSWTTAQVLAGVLSAGVSLKDGNLKRSFQYLIKHQEDGGWSRLETPKTPSTEVTSWVGLAGLLSLHRPDIWGTSQEEAKRMVQDVYKEVTRRQTKTGGWSTFQNFDASQSLNVGAYASVMALVFLLQVENGDAKWVVSNESKLKEQIRRGLEWILATYNGDIEGWEEIRGEGLNHELTTYNLLLLTQAKRQGFEYIKDRPEYKKARLVWLKKRNKETSDGPTHSMIKQEQYVSEGNTQDTRLEIYAVKLMRYPWFFLLATVLGDDSSLPEEERNLAHRVSSTFWARLDDSIKSVSTGHTYTAAETLLCLGWIGQHYHWIGNHDWGKPALPAVTAVN